MKHELQQPAPRKTTIASRPSTTGASSSPPRTPPWLSRASGVIPGLLALLLAVGVVALGQRTGWRLSSFSSLFGRELPPAPAWCDVHSVADAFCVECRQDVMPRGKDFGWCKFHGIHECPLCHPELAQLEDTPVISQEDLDRVSGALEFSPRDENNSRCQLHLRRIQLASSHALHDIGVEVAPAQREAVTESISTLGEIRFDPTQIVRISPRVNGVLWRLEKRVGDEVHAGELLALVDAVEVGKAKAEFQQALTNLQLKTENLARRKPLAGETIAAHAVQAAEAETVEAQGRVLASRQALINLGFPVAGSDSASADPGDLARHLRWLGVPAPLQAAIARETSSNNLLPVRSPFDGVVIQCDNVPGEAVTSNSVLFVVANQRSLWLQLHVALENATRVRKGQRVRFQHDGHSDWDEGTVSFVGLSVDEATRTVPVIVELPNVDEQHVSGAFGNAMILLREEPSAVVVPSSAIHWEGDCHIVFVQDKHFQHEGTPQVFHVRKVRPGVQDLALGVPVTEVIAGLLPGEIVATTNSGIFRSELLKADLGAG